MKCHIVANTTLGCLFPEYCYENKNMAEEAVSSLENLYDMAIGNNHKYTIVTTRSEIVKDVIQSSFNPFTAEYLGLTNIPLNIQS